MIMLLKFLAIIVILSAACNACSDFYMNFSAPDIRLSVRTMDLGAEMTNWTFTAWPRGTTVDFSSLPPLTREQALSGEPIKYAMLGVSANWFGDNHWGFPTFFGDSINEKGLSCSLLTLVGTKYEHYSARKTNVFAGSFCKWATSQHANVLEVQAALDDIAIYGPDILAEHFILRDADGLSLVIEVMDHKKVVYLDRNDGVSGFGITTNEPTLDWHIENIKHYEWKRTLSRQSVAVPGNWYPEERFLRIHMVKSGMKSYDSDVTDYAQAFSLSAQVLNTVTVPQGEQYGTDTGENSGEGSSNDHTVFGLIRDHLNPTLYWRDNTNPTFRRLRVADISGKFQQLMLESGPYFIDMAAEMHAP